jgi:hypothetical protein
MKLHGEYDYDIGFANKISLEFTAAYSDKASYHGYNEAYSHILFGKQYKSFLEIGLFLNDNQHTDLFAWEQILAPADIWGADIKEHLLFNRGKIRTMFLDQSKDETFAPLKEAVGNQLDIILDDASHVYELTVNTFDHMFECLADGGVYLIEDMLVNGANPGSYEQRLEDLVAYVEGKGLTYEAFGTSMTNTIVDSSVLAIYK